jgi:hypothetical protein
MNRRYVIKLFWPLIIILSALVAGLVNFVFPGAVGRPIIVLWFLSVCPGMALIRFLQLKEPIAEWTLAIALSFAIDATVAGIQVYSGLWYPEGTLGILIGFCLVIALIQIVQLRAYIYKVFFNLFDS